MLGKKIRYLKVKSGGFASADQADQGAMTAVLTGVDTGTDMTAAQAATIVADFTALDKLLTAIRTALVEAGIMKGAA